MKTPFEQAIKLYAEHPDMRFSDDLALHLSSGGYVVAGPEFIAMIRPVMKDWQPDMLAHISIIAPADDADCWFVWLLCGSLSEAARHLPYRLPWFGFSQRGQPARFVEAEKVLAKIG